jgi:hypothetical protein
VAVKIPSARPAPTESRRLSETRRAAIFGVMLRTLAVAAALLIELSTLPKCSRTSSGAPLRWSLS